MKAYTGRIALLVGLAFVIGWSIAYQAKELNIDEVTIGLLNSVISGLAIILIVWTIVIQREELRLQRMEMGRLVSMQQRQVHIELISHAMSNPKLAEVWGSTGTDHMEPQQFFYVNMIISQWWTAFSEELLPKEEVERLLIEHMSISPHFRHFWAHPKNGWPRIVDQSPRRSAFVAMAQQAYEVATSTPSRETAGRGGFEED